MIPDLFLLTSVIYFALVYTRRIAVAYAMSFIVVICFIVAFSAYDTAGATPALLFLDPMGLTVVSHYFDTLASVAKNTAYMRLESYVVSNRLFWLGLGLLFFLAAYYKFSFKSFLRRDVRSKALGEPENEKDVALPPVAHMHVGQIFSFGSFLSRLAALSRLEFKNLVRPVSFKIILFMLMLMIVLQNLVWNATYYIGAQMPVTSAMTYFRLPWGVYIILLLILWSGELFFKDRTVGIWQITDALPVPVWVTQLSRLFALFAMSFTLTLGFIFIGVIVQAVQGSAAEIDLGRYAEDVLGFRWGLLNYWLFIVLVFFIASLTQSRFATHALSVAYFIFLIVSFDMKLLEQVRIGYALTPGVEDHSEMNGYGVWSVAARHFFWLWATLALALVVFALWFWRRGTGKSLMSRLSFRNPQISAKAKALAFAAVGFFAVQQYGLVGKVYASGNFRTKAQVDARAADYERRYSRLENEAQPKYKGVNLLLDLFPNDRRAEYTAEMTFVNNSERAIDKLYLNFKDFVQVLSLTHAGVALKLLSHDREHNLQTYALPKSLAPRASLNIRLKAEKAYHGFTQSGKDPQADLTYNGSFAGIREFLPVVGYDDERPIKENRKRRGQNLKPLESRMAEAQDAHARGEDAFGHDAEWVTGEIVLGTSADQTPIAPGRLVRAWSENGRNYRRYTVEKPLPFHWFIGSAHYEELKGAIGSTQTTVFYHPRHTYNVKLIDETLKQAIAFTEKKLGAYSYPSAFVAEVPQYHEDLFSFPGGVAFSEKDGWYADARALKEKAYITQLVAAQVFKHWIQANIRVANVEGADTLRVALAEAFALEFLRETLGKEAFETILKKKSDKYAKDRTNEPNTEPSVLRDDGAEYLAPNKGAIDLHRAMAEMGFDKFVAALKSWMASGGKDYRTFEGLFALLKPHLRPETQRAFMAAN